MTILLTLEALDEGRVSAQDQVTVSPRAASMGGSQAFLDAGERYPLGELLKTVIVASANDSAVAIAEHLAGAEEAFVKLMNARADELGLQNTHYVNCTGLPACAKACAMQRSYQPSPQPASSRWSGASAPAEAPYARHSSPSARPKMP